MYCNPAVESILGYTGDQFGDIHAWNHLAYPDPEKRREVEEAWQKDMLTDKKALSHRTFRVRCADGSVKDVLFRAGSLSENEYFLLMEDITQRLAAEQGLTRSESLLRAVLEGSPDVVLVLDRRGRVLMANLAAKELFGNHNLKTGKRALDLLPPERSSWGRSLWEWVLQGKVVSGRVGATPAGTGRPGDVRTAGG